MSFTNSSHTAIAGENTFNHVQGNQVNVNFNTIQAMVKRTKYDQFREVIHGDMIILKEIHSKEIADWEWEYKYGKMTGKHEARRTTCIVEVYPDRQSKFTAVMYEGEDAQCVWEKEFEKFTRNRNPLVTQLFGINRSEIPMLIFHDELIPLAHFFNIESIWMDVYIDHLRRNMRCSQDNLWANTASGVLFSGPDGPSAPFILSDAMEFIIVPTTVDMLKDDTCLRFFPNFGSRMDHCVLECANSSRRLSYHNNLVPVTIEDHQSKDSDYPSWSSATRRDLRRLWRNPLDHFPTNITGRLRFDTVYSPPMGAVARWSRGARSLWKWRNYNGMGLAEETVLDDGLTRFQLDLTRGKGIYLDAVYAYGRLQRGKKTFFLFGHAHWRYDLPNAPQLSTASAMMNIPSKKPHPHPSTSSFIMSIFELVSWMNGHFYFWSFDKTGQSQMSEEECISVRLRLWPAHIYPALRDWQKARGFDPTTSDWARYMGSPEFEILSDLGRFKEVRELRINNFVSRIDRL
ncbi:hypothetical protein Moror_10876 [Moniliophthora roreri MCA 2997]|uniref:Uncharacterized protein n=1 Tax=Moniliophthora roreri (strain MCA 2997) TaxID=1381753 RepID=V2X2B4_MONRO|nr:hypothetical protein Moror_10876 [Moniliophthora roreri MCA 2997]